MSRKRIIVLFCVLALVAVAAAGGWVAGTRIESPAEAAARTAAPTPSPILVPVEERVLSSNVVTRGTARFGLPQPISIAPSALKPKPGLITTLPLRNTQFNEGSVMLTASGRPVFVLQGQIPAYRDLVPGITGDDVRQLEAGLERLGFDPGPVDGTYDGQTSAAVAEWYSSAGREPFGPTLEQLAQIRTLEQDLGGATRNKLVAVHAAAAAALTVESTRTTAAHAHQAAAADVETRIAVRDKTKAALAIAARAVEAARATAEHTDKSAAADVEARIAARDKVNAALAIAGQAVEATRAIADHSYRVAVAELAAKIADAQRLVPASENDIPLAVESARAKTEYANRAAQADVAARIAERAVIVMNPLQTRTARAAADAQLELARAARFHIQLEGEMAVQAAERAANLAVGRTELAEAALKAAQLEGERLVQAALDAQKVAEHEVRLAEAQIELARAAARAAQLEGGRAVQAALDAQQAARREADLAETPIELARAAARAAHLEGEKAVQAAVDAQQVAELDLRLATERADRLATDLNLARRKVDVQVPVDEMVFIPALPVRVEEVTVLVGDAASGPVMKVTDNQLAIDSSLRLDAAPLVKPGMPVAIDEQALGIKAQGVVERVAKTPGTHGVDGYHIYFGIRVTETRTPLEGFSLRLTIPIESTKGAVIAVPLSALSLAADGTSRVRVENNGRLEYVVVEPGMSADGFVEVAPVDGTLEPGQLVVVGFENGEHPDTRL